LPGAMRSPLGSPSLGTGVMYSALCASLLLDAVWQKPAVVEANTAKSGIRYETVAHGGADSMIEKEFADFKYHKDVWPLDFQIDGLTLIAAIAGIIIAAGGGIGGGGILVPIYMLLLRFHPKHAIALSNITIMGGAIANTFFNAGKTNPATGNPLIDWDLIAVMEPLTIVGADLGSLGSKVLPSIVLTIALVIILAYMGYHTLAKAFKMWNKESDKLQQNDSDDEMVELSLRDGCDDSDLFSPHQPAAARVLEGRGGAERSVHVAGDHSGNESESSEEGCCLIEEEDGKASWIRKASLLTFCFIGNVAFTVLRGGGTLGSPLGDKCGSVAWWCLELASIPWICCFALYFRHLLISEYETKVARGHVFREGEVKWDSWNTIKYPVICTLSGVFAGLFGVGGGIVKGPLMLEMGIPPAIASATAATMILYTSCAASVSFIAFGLLHPTYAVMFWCVGLSCTAIGQIGMTRLMKQFNRDSPIVFSIGAVISLSSVLVALNTYYTSYGHEWSELLVISGVCMDEVAANASVAVTTTLAPALAP